MMLYCSKIAFNDFRLCDINAIKSTKSYFLFIMRVCGIQKREGSCSIRKILLNFCVILNVKIFDMMDCIVLYISRSILYQHAYKCSSPNKFSLFTTCTYAHYIYLKFVLFVVVIIIEKIE